MTAVDKSPQTEPRLTHGLLVVACYSLWLLLSALTVWTVLQLRLNVIDLIFVLRVNPWATRSLDTTATLLLGLVGLAVIVFLETYLREGVGRGSLWTRVRRAGLPLLAVLAVSYALRWLLPRLL